MGQLEGAIASAACSGKRQQVKPRGAPSKVDRIEWLRGEVARLEAAVLEARARAYAFNSTPSFFVMFRCAAGGHGARPVQGDAAG